MGGKGEKYINEYILNMSMGKSHVNVSIDDELVEKAKDAQINISAVTETALRHKLNVKDVEIPMIEGETCKKCKRQLRKATKENMNGLTWLWPDEIWICNSCLTKESSRIAI